MTKKVTVPWVRESKDKPLAVVSLYDYTFARIADRAGVDLILVGDSLGCVVQGHRNTLPVTLEQMIYHTQCVVRGVERALVVADLPFLSYQISEAQAIESAGRLIKEGGASAVKLEGGAAVAAIVERLVKFDIPVMGHIGMTPQSYHRMGGHRVQGKTGAIGAGSAKQIAADALALEKAGVFSIVIECVPHTLARSITKKASIPTIGIGAGLDCNGQVLVAYDLLGMTDPPGPRFLKRFAELGRQIESGFKEFSSQVREKKYPETRHSYRAEE